MPTSFLNKYKVQQSSPLTVSVDLPFYRRLLFWIGELVAQGLAGKQWTVKPFKTRTIQQNRLINLAFRGVLNYKGSMKEVLKDLSIGTLGSLLASLIWFYWNKIGDPMKKIS